MTSTPWKFQRISLMKLDDFGVKYDKMCYTTLTCAQRLKWVSLIYGTEPKNYKVEKEKNGYAQKQRKQSAKFVDS